MAMATTNSRAADLALAHCKAWSNHDWDTARKALADDVKVTATTTMPGAPNTDLVGTDAYMQGLRAFAGTVVPGTLQVNASVSAGPNALLHVTVQTDGPPFGPLTLHGARLYLFDDNDKIKEEQVIFVGVPR
jgi:hypothetical protein